MPNNNGMSFEWLQVQTSSKALIKKYENHSFMQMPKTGEYSGYTYSLFNNRVTKINGDDNNILVKLGSDESIEIRNKEGNKITLKAKDFLKEIENQEDKDYISSKSNYQLHLSKDALVAEYAASYMFTTPLNCEYTNKVYFLSKSLVERQEVRANRNLLPKRKLNRRRKLIPMTLTKAR